MSAIDKFLFDAGMEGFNDPSSIPSSGIVVPFFGVEEFAAADTEQAERMVEMNRQADAIYKLQETLVYINANRPSFDRGNAEHVVQALGEVQVLMPNMEDPVTIMGSLEHYTPAYTNHLLGFGTESITAMINTAIKKLIELLIKGTQWLLASMRSARVVLGKQKRDVAELNAWLKANKSNAAPVMMAPSQQFTVSNPFYFCETDTGNLISPDRLPREIRGMGALIRSLRSDFIARYIAVGRSYLKAINDVNLNQSSNALYTQVFKGQPVFAVLAKQMKVVNTGRMGSLGTDPDYPHQINDLVATADIAGFGFVAPNVPKEVYTPVAMTNDASAQRLYFKRLRFLQPFDMTVKIGATQSYMKPSQPQPCSAEEAVMITDELNALIDLIVNDDSADDIAAFNKEVMATIESLRKYRFTNAATISEDADRFADDMGYALYAMANAVSKLPYGIAREVNNFANIMREYVAKSIKS